MSSANYVCQSACMNQSQCATLVGQSPPDQAQCVSHCVDSINNSSKSSKSMAAAVYESVWGAANVSGTVNQCYAIETLARFLEPPYSKK
jgi:hypothetical protein